ncbi:MAG: gamma carbonic anhydrase family protein [Eubacteriales bacterium]|nr:gamma carbonic anhydrase family protein [Eubacteriales bacterium]
MEKKQGIDLDPSVFVAEGAKIIGDHIQIGKNSSVWYNAVLRASGEELYIGENSNVQDLCLFHAEPGNPIHIGDYVTIGHNAIIHGCEIGDNTLVGMGAIVMNHAKIGKNCLIAAGALVTENTVVPEGTLVMGSPAKARRMLTPEEIDSNRENAEEYVQEAEMEKSRGGR